MDCAECRIKQYWPAHILRGSVAQRTRRRVRQGPVPRECRGSLPDAREPRRTRWIRSGRALRELNALYCRRQRSRLVRNDTGGARVQCACMQNVLKILLYCASVSHIDMDIAWRDIVHCSLVILKLGVCLLTVSDGHPNTVINYEHARVTYVWWEKRL